jgi:hypothetical protein
MDERDYQVPFAFTGKSVKLGVKSPARLSPEDIMKLAAGQRSNKASE